MRKTARVALRVFIVLIAVVVIALAAGLDRVDFRRFSGEAYYTRTIEQLRLRAQTNHLARGTLAAGFGQAKLSPALNAAGEIPAEGRFRALPLAGYGNRHGKPATGVHDHLFVKAMALRASGRLGVMVGCDALIVPAEVTDLAMQQLSRDPGLSREQLYLSATHTHSSIGGWGEGIVPEMFAGGFQPGARAWFADRIVVAVRAAIADLTPAEFGYGHFIAPDLIRNRLVGKAGTIDPTFTFAVLKQQGGRVGVLGVFGAHATVLPGDNMEFSADYPGSWQRSIEEATGGFAMFVAGGVGSHAPLPAGKRFEGAEKMGKTLAQRVMEQLPRVAMTNNVIFGMLAIDVALPPLNVRVTDGIRLRPWVARRLLPARHESFIQVFRVNDSLWVSTPCDFSGELALGTKAFLKEHGADATITSFNGDYIGYVILPRYYHRDGYEPRVMSFFGPNVPEYFDELIRSMGLSIMNAR